MNTQDLARFGYRELDMAADLLKQYANNPPEFLGGEVRVEFNPNSGEVFLVDEDYTVAMFNGKDLEQWYSCDECGHEGFTESFDIKKDKNNNKYLHCPQCKSKDENAVAYLSN